LQHVDTLKQIHVELRLAELARAIGKRHAVEIEHRLETSDAQGVEAGIVRTVIGGDARRISERLNDGPRALIADLLAPDNRDCLRNFQKRRVGLGADQRAMRDITLNRTIAPLECVSADDRFGTRSSYGAV